MKDYITQIAQKEKKARFDAIVSVLERNNVPYRVQELPCWGAIGNLLVTFNPDSPEKKLAITAHYDNIPGTPGANDNASACSILLNLILAAKESGTDKHLEFAFFDLEENGLTGSRYYLDENRRNLAGVFNLDMCGMGSNTVISIQNGAEKMLSTPLTPDIHVLKTLPMGDAYTFIDAGIPTVYIINSTDKDLPWFCEYAETRRQPAGIPDFARTMHRPEDTPDTCNPIQMERIYQFINENINGKKENQ